MEDKEAKPFKEIKPGDTVYCFDLTDNSLTKFKVREAGQENEDFTVIFEDTYQKIGESEDYYDLSKPVFVQEECLYSTSINAIHEFLANAVKAITETIPVLPKRTGYGFIDDPIGISPFESDCIFCKYFNLSYTCDAFPKGIPRVYLNGDDKHTKIDDDQEGDYVFTPDE